VASGGYPQAMPLELRNPHAVLAALEARPGAVEQVTVGARPSDAWRAVAEAARSSGRPVVDAASSRRGARRGANAFAVVDERAETPLGELWTDPEPGALWLALDSVQDPQNLGSIFRTAAFFGVRGVVLPRDRSASLTEAAYDVASGAVELVPHATVTNLSRALDAAKDAGIWTVGSSEHAERSIWELGPDRAWLLVLGNEERGLRRLTLERCDELVAIQPRGELTSLNVAVAAGVLMAALTGGA
jgi:23S rRNA (guanosine2251-2'-O)-methyltransferase